MTSRLETGNLWTFFYGVALGVPLASSIGRYSTPCLSLPLSSSWTRSRAAPLLYLFPSLWRSIIRFSGEANERRASASIISRGRSGNSLSQVFTTPEKKEKPLSQQKILKTYLLCKKRSWRLCIYNMCLCQWYICRYIDEGMVGSGTVIFLIVGHWPKILSQNS